MAKIVLGIGTSHTPMLLATDETLPRFVETDMKIKHRDKEGNPASYEELLLKADPQLSGMVTPEQLVVRQNSARAATRRLRQVLSSANLDALIVLGDDQNESYLEDCRPAIAVYYGETIRNDNKQHGTYSHLPEWYIKNRAGFFETEAPRDYPVHSALALHLIESLMDADFDLAGSKCLRAGEGEGHAVAYVHRHVMDSERPVPVVPIFLNTYFAPTQPRPRRCYQLGQGIARAVEQLSGRGEDRRAGVGRAQPLPGRRGFRPVDPQGLRRQGCDVPAEPAAQQAARGQLRNPQLGGGRRRHREPASRLVRVCAGLSHGGRHRHRHELRHLGLIAPGPDRLWVILPGVTFPVHKSCAV